MVSPVGNPAPTTPAKKAEEKKEGTRSEGQSPSPAPAPAPAPNAGNTGSNDVNMPTNGLDPKVAFDSSQGLKKRNAPANSGDAGNENSDSQSRTKNATNGDVPEPKAAGGPEPENVNEPEPEGGGGADPKDTSDNSENGVSLEQLQGYREDALKDMDTLNVLTDPEKMEGGSFKDKTIFEAIAGDDGQLSLEDAQEAKSKVSSDLDKMLKGPPLPGMPDVPKEAIEKAQKLDKALGDITTNGNFERLAGDKGYIDIDGLNKEKENKQKEIDNLTTLTTDGNFEAVAGNDGFLSQKDAEEAAKNGSNDAVKSASEWLSKDEAFSEAHSSEAPMDKNKALSVLNANFGKTDNAAGIWHADGVFSIKDLDKLKAGNDELADAAQVLLDEDIFGELGNGDDKISREELNNYIGKNYDLNKEYENIKIENGTFSEEELTTLNGKLAFLANDPDGKRLLENINNRDGGFTFKKDAEAASEIGAAAYVSGNELVLSSVEDTGDFLSLLTHEMTHAASTEGGGANGESLSSVLGHRIWSRYEGDHEFKKDNGDTVTFDGSKEAEEMVFIEEIKKRDGDNPTSESYGAGYGDYLRSLGFDFDFNTNVENIVDGKPVYAGS